MKPYEFGEDALVRLLFLYKRAFGGMGVREYIEDPNLMLWSVQQPENWITPIAYHRIGSKWSGDTKLGFKVSQEGDLEVTVYLNFKAKEKVMKQAEEAETRFIRSANALLRGKNQ